MVVQNVQGPPLEVPDDPYEVYEACEQVRPRLSQVSNDSGLPAPLSADCVSDRAVVWERALKPLLDSTGRQRLLMF